MCEGWREKFEKIFKPAAITAIVITTAIWFYNQYEDSHKAWLMNYKKSSFSGVIKDTVKILGHGGMPTYFFTNDSSHLSDINEVYMQDIAKVGDSLGKVSGNDTIYVFRKQDSGYVQIYPKQ